jgi:hypothetical protein
MAGFEVTATVLGDVVGDTRGCRYGVANAVSGYTSEQAADGGMSIVVSCIQRYEVSWRAETDDPFDRVINRFVIAVGRECVISAEPGDCGDLGPGRVPHEDDILGISWHADTCLFREKSKEAVAVLPLRRPERRRHQEIITAILRGRGSGRCVQLGLSPFVTAVTR